MTQTIEFNQAKADKFADNLLSIINNASVAFMISVGHRTGLFDVLRELPPSTPEEIAKKADLNLRYVQEWLGAMVLGGIVKLDAGKNTFSFPQEHAAFMTRAHAADNVATFTQYMAVLGTVEDEIVHCFKHGGGVPYSSFKRFHEVMAEDSGQSVLPALIDKILPLIPGIVTKLEKGIHVLDMGCGRGKALMLMAETFPKSQFTGWDLSQEAIDWANRQVKQKSLPNIHFEQKDLTKFPTGKKFDFITSFDAVHDQARPDLVLTGIQEALKTNGVYLMQDIAGSSHIHKNKNLPLGPLLYTISTFHCMTVSLAQNGMGLGTLWGEEKAVRMLKEAGFKTIDIKKLPHDIQNQYYIVKK